MGGLPQAFGASRGATYLQKGREADLRRACHEWLQYAKKSAIYLVHTENMLCEGCV